MAYAALVSLAQTLDQILDHGSYYINSPHEEEQIISVKKHVILLQAFLESFPDNADKLEGRIRDVANQAEDIMEDFMLVRIRLRRSRFGYIHHFWNEIHPHWAQLRYHLEKATEKIESIAEQVEQVMNINNSFRIKDKQQLYDPPGAASSSEVAPTHKDVMIGFDDDLTAIKAQLCGESSQLRVIPIFGMGGIGKTTLARNAYEDPLVMEYFHIRAWVTISQDYSAQEILSSLLVSMEGFNEERSGQSNEEKVYRSLKGGRYLVVLDDMWSTKAWDEVRNIFPNDGVGSRIMLTTRLSDVAAYPDLCSSIYEIRFMDEDQSWKLLRNKVFARQDCPLELEDIGKEIARSCKGLPLAIVVIAGLLSTVSKNPASWREIAENVNSVVAAKDGQFEEILSLSYTHLPHHLRPCFLYMGGFPEDHEVRVSKLIKLWVGEGFLKRPNGSKSLEEEAEECLEDLVKRSLVLVTKRKSNGRIKSCSLHGLMRDLCIRKDHEENFLVNVRDGYVGKELLINPRRMSIAFIGPIPDLSKTNGSTIHTIMWFLYTSLPSLESARLLRVLDAGDADVHSLPAQLFELFHLRYLAINYCYMIPAAISRLQNLQTLIIRARGQWKVDAALEDCLPHEIWMMPQLRHLFFYGRLPNPTQTASTLENLQTLLFSVSSGTCTEGILEMVPNLKKLEITHDRDGDFDFNSLVRLHQLETLQLHSHNIRPLWRPDNFTFPRMLRKLTLSSFGLLWDEMMTVCSLPNLQVLKLRDFACRGSIWETIDGNFPKLEFLLIEKSYLEDWITEACHFPRLKFLLIHDCWRLREIPNGIGEILTLELIEIKGHVKKSPMESAKQIQEVQQSWGDGALHIRCMTH